MKRIPDLWWNIVAYALWAVGCALFVVVAARDGDMVGLWAGLLFLLGVLVVLVPLVRESKNRNR